MSTPPPAYQPPPVTPFDVNHVPANTQANSNPLPHSFPVPAPAPAPSIIFELMLSVIQPAKRIRTAGKRTKAEKADTVSVGPVNCNTAIGWDDFLGIVAEMLTVQRGNLAINSFEWHFLKPASGAWLPLQSNTGFISMLRKISGKLDAYVIVRMQSPKPDHTTPTRPWITTGGAVGSLADNTGIDDYDFEPDDRAVMRGASTFYSLCIVLVLITFVR